MLFFILLLLVYFFCGIKFVKEVFPMSENKEDKKEIKVVTGDGNGLDISPVYDHIKSDLVPDNDGKKKDIVIPKGGSEKK
jgi:hypothetical protein